MNLIEALRKTGKAQLLGWGELHVYVDEGSGLMIKHFGGKTHQYRWYTSEVNRGDWISYPIASKKCEACKILAKNEYWDKTLLFLLKQHCTCKENSQ